MIKNVLFDLDGTLIDSSGDVIDCIRTAYMACGFDVVQLTINPSMMGPPLQVMLRMITPGLSDADAVRVVNAFRGVYDSSDYTMTIPCEGVTDALARCTSAGMRLFVVTNKPQLPTMRILQKNRIGPFDDVVTPDTVSGRIMSKREMIGYILGKHELAAAETVMVGDADGDVIAARENGLVTVGVRSGYGDAAALAASCPSRLIKDMEALYETIQELSLRGGAK